MLEDIFTGLILLLFIIGVYAIATRLIVFIIKRKSKLNNKIYSLRTLHVPPKVEMKVRDFLEVIVGASILALPVAFTEEVWNLGQNLPQVIVFYA